MLPARSPRERLQLWCSPGAVAVQFAGTVSTIQATTNPLTSTNTHPTAVRALIPINGFYSVQRVP